MNVLDKENNKNIKSLKIKVRPSSHLPIYEIPKCNNEYGKRI